MLSCPQEIGLTELKWGLVMTAQPKSADLKASAPIAGEKILNLALQGGGSHGAQWHNGKLWIVANRPRLLLRVDPKTWAPEAAIPIYAPADKPRWHDMTFDADGNIWQVTGNDSKSYKEGRPGLVKYDARTGELLETAEFQEGTADPHGLAMHNGKLISCDAGVGPPGFEGTGSPSAGYVFEINFV